MKYSALAGGVAARLFALDEATTHYKRAVEIARQVNSSDLGAFLEALGKVKSA